MSDDLVGRDAATVFFIHARGFSCDIIQDSDDSRGREIRQSSTLLSKRRAVLLRQGSGREDIRDERKHRCNAVAAGDVDAHVHPASEHGNTAHQAGEHDRLAPYWRNHWVA